MSSDVSREGLKSRAREYSPSTRRRLKRALLERFVHRTDREKLTNKGHTSVGKLANENGRNEGAPSQYGRKLASSDENRECAQQCDGKIAISENNRKEFSLHKYDENLAISDNQESVFRQFGGKLAISENNRKEFSFHKFAENLSASENIGKGIPQQSNGKFAINDNHRDKSYVQQTLGKLATTQTQHSRNLTTDKQSGEISFIQNTLGKLATTQTQHSGRNLATNQQGEKSGAVTDVNLAIRPRVNEALSQYFDASSRIFENSATKRCDKTSTPYPSHHHGKTTEFYDEKLANTHQMCGNLAHSQQFCGNLANYEQLCGNLANYLQRSGNLANSQQRSVNLANSHKISGNLANSEQLSGILAHSQQFCGSLANSNINRSSTTMQLHDVNLATQRFAKKISSTIRMYEMLASQKDDRPQLDKALGRNIAFCRGKDTEVSRPQPNEGLATDIVFQRGKHMSVLLHQTDEDLDADIAFPCGKRTEVPLPHPNHDGLATNSAFYRGNQMSVPKPHPNESLATNIVFHRGKLACGYNKESVRQQDKSTSTVELSSDRVLNPKRVERSTYIHHSEKSTNIQQYVSRSTSIRVDGLANMQHSDKSTNIQHCLDRSTNIQYGDKLANIQTVNKLKNTQQYPDNHLQLCPRKFDNTQVRDKTLKTIQIFNAKSVLQANEVISRTESWIERLFSSQEYDEVLEEVHLTGERLSINQLYASKNLSNNLLCTNEELFNNELYSSENLSNNQLSIDKTLSNNQVSNNELGADKKLSNNQLYTDEHLSNNQLYCSLKLSNNQVCTDKQSSSNQLNTSENTACNQPSMGEMSCCNQLSTNGKLSNNQLCSSVKLSNKQVCTDKQSSSNQLNTSENSACNQPSMGEMSCCNQLSTNGKLSNNQLCSSVKLSNKQVCTDKQSSSNQLNTSENSACNQPSMGEMSCCNQLSTNGKLSNNQLCSSVKLSNNQASVGEKSCSNQLSTNLELADNQLCSSEKLANNQLSTSEKLPTVFDQDEIVWNKRYRHEWDSIHWSHFYEEFCNTSSSSTSSERSCGSESDSEYATREDQLETESSERAAPNKSPNIGSITILSDTSLPPIEQSSTSLITGDSDLSSKKSRVRVVATICLDLCSYELVGRVARQCGMTVVDDKSLWDVLWSDPCIGPDTHRRMKRFQRTNHFPLIMELCRKNLLAKNLNQMKIQYPNDYNFFPQTWILPRDNREVHAFLTSKKATVIVKPDNGSNGLGISLIRNLRHLSQEQNRNYICQEYIANPFLIDGLKFDMRVYTLITSFDPMRIYVHKDGIVRFATVKYERPKQGNLTNKYMHLTNYSVNKHSISFIHDEEVGSKRKISTINQWFCRMGYDTDLVWSRIDDVIVKTVLSAHPNIKTMYNSVFPRHNYMTACFQLLGFDILLDDTLNPYVLEVNHSPSFYTDTEIDVEIKEQVLRDTFVLCNLNSSIKRKVLQEERLEAQRRLFKRPEREEDEEERQTCKEGQWAWERAHMGNFRLLYPCQDGDKYDSMCRAIESASYYKDTFSSNMRSMLGRAHRQDMDMRRDNQGVTPRPSKDTLDSIYGKKRRKPCDDVALMKKPSVRTNKTKVVKSVQTKRKVETPRDSYNRKDVENKAKQLKLPKVLVTDKPKSAIQVKVPKIAQKPAKKPVKPTRIPLKPANIPKPTSVPAKAANIPAKSTSISAKPTNNSAKPANIIFKLVTIPSKSDNPKPTKPTVTKGQRRSKAPPEANIDPVEEIHRLTEWKKRVTFVESMDIKRFIYFCFKKTNNLSDRDLLLHRYLEVKV
ncbi:hypothetical protein M8J77_002320 [Diaphorina citri]|nr:hypothetical protein M8J77_002320 [Diaphorina citri]